MLKVDIGSAFMTARDHHDSTACKGGTALIADAHAVRVATSISI